MDLRSAGNVISSAGAVLVQEPRLDSLDLVGESSQA